MKNLVNIYVGTAAALTVAFAFGISLMEYFHLMDSMIGGVVVMLFIIHIIVNSVLLQKDTHTAGDLAPTYLNVMLVFIVVVMTILVSPMTVEIYFLRTILLTTVALIINFVQTLYHD